jgi:hypothetical protein
MVPSGAVPTRRQMCPIGWVKTLGESHTYDFGSVEGTVRSRAAGGEGAGSIS